MCMTLPVRVVSVQESVAIVEVGGQRRVASTAAVPSVAPGDWAILSAGLLIRILDPATASQMADAYRFATSTDGDSGRSAGISAQGGES